MKKYGKSIIEMLFDENNFLDATGYFIGSEELLRRNWYMIKYFNLN